MKTLFTGLNCIELQSTDSTNNYAAILLKQTNVPEGTVILAHEQTQGKGQRGAIWLSEKGKNLTFSVIYKPVFLSVTHQFMLSKITALALLKLVSKYADNVKIKWPNDIWVNNKKIAGVLIENNVSGNVIQSSVIGVGININQVMFMPELNATSLYLENKKVFDSKEILSEFCVLLEGYYLQLRNNSINKIEDEYLQYLFGINQWLKYNYYGKNITAIITGVSTSGKLCLTTTDNNKLECEVKEIKFVF